jgi:transposase-like protein
MKRRRFTQDFKSSVVEQLLSETAGPAEICRRYNIASGQLYTRKKQYAGGKLDPEPSREADLEARVRELPGKRILKKSRAQRPQTSREKAKFIAQNRALIQSVERGC